MNESIKDTVAVVTGASRGIGRALALGLAAEGAKVVIAAKSEAETERLPGSIYSVAEEIEQVGGEALPLRVDVRDDAQVKKMVERTVERFDRLDFLVNNAGALWWRPILETSPKRYDLLWQVNVRGAYLCTYYALPHMVAARFGHILFCSPPLSVDAHPGYACYMTTKMGMTRLALAVAAEHRADNIASNALWPATPIESQATINWEIGRRETWRSPAVLVDAALEVLRTPPAELTGRQLIDEEILRERGWSQADLDAYWCGDGPPEQPVFIDGRPAAAM